MTRVHLRTATPADLALLRRWDAEPHVIASSGADDWGWEEEDLAHNPDWREQLIAEADDVPIGVIQIIDPAREDTHYWGDCPDGLRAIDIWIGEKAYLGQGLGTEMMTEAIARCFAEPSVDGIVIDPLASNTRARRFYERLGFEFVENRRFGDDDCAVYSLARSAWLSGASESRGARDETAALVKIRDAMPGDCLAATDLCLRSKASWGYDEPFLEQSRNALTLTPERLEGWTVRIAEGSDGALVGVAAFWLVPGASDQAELELLFVEPGAQGTGVGGALLRDAMARLRERAVKTLWILSDPGAEPFYLQHGAIRVGLRPSDAIPGRQLPWLRLDIGPALAAPE